jgi:hypothetical protein
MRTATAIAITAATLCLTVAACIGEEKQGDADGAAGGGSGGADAEACIAPVLGPCDTFPQCGCEPGKACMPYTDGTTFCSTHGSVAAYQSCGSPLICDAGMMCVGQVCKPFCATRDDCPGPERSCKQLFALDEQQNTVAVPEAFYCTAGCDLLFPESVCGPGVTCRPLEKGTEGTDCWTAGNGIGPGTCPSSELECKPGYACVDTGTRDCLRWCRVGYPDCGTQTCQSVGVLVGGFEYGACPWGS